MFVSQDFFNDEDQSTQENDLQSSNSQRPRKKNIYIKVPDFDSATIHSNYQPNRLQNGSKNILGVSPKNPIISTSRPNIAATPKKSLRGNITQNFSNKKDQQTPSNNVNIGNNNNNQREELDSSIKSFEVETVKTSLSYIYDVQSEQNKIQPSPRAELIIFTNRGSFLGDQRRNALLRQKQRLLDQQRMQFTRNGVIQSSNILTNRSQQSNEPLCYKIDEEKDHVNTETTNFTYRAKKESLEIILLEDEPESNNVIEVKKNSRFKEYEKDTFKIPNDKEAQEKQQTEEDSDKYDEDNELNNDQLLEQEKREFEEKPFEANGQNDSTKEEKISTVLKDKEQGFNSQNLNMRLFDSSDIKTFLMQPAPKNCIIKCTIKRDKSGFARFCHKYYVSLSNEYRFLMGAKKRAYNKTSNYAISMSSKDFSNKSPNYLGKLRANFLGTEFNIWDHGLNPKKTHLIQKIREQLGVVLYEPNFLEKKVQRKMKVLIPAISPNGEPMTFRPLSIKEGMLSNLSSGKREGMNVLVNKPPRWNEEIQSYVLEFNTRVEKPSDKNFQLVDEKNEDNVLLQFGKVSDNTFTMDFQWPLSPFQAFAICLSSFDYKLACK